VALLRARKATHEPLAQLRGREQQVRLKPLAQPASLALLQLLGR
jgi:hypothetical protein